MRGRVDRFGDPRIVDFRPSVGGVIVAAAKQIAGVAAFDFHTHDIIPES